MIKILYLCHCLLLIELENIFIHYTVKIKAAILSTYFTIVLLAPSNVLSTKLLQHASIVRKGLSYGLILFILSEVLWYIVGINRSLINLY